MFVLRGVTALTGSLGTLLMKAKIISTNPHKFYLLTKNYGSSM